MAEYVDGFVLPIPRTRLEDYRRVAQAAAEIWKEHGAIDYREFVGDDLARQGTGSFREMLSATPDEVIVFGWVTFASREMRDIANEKAASDPRMPELMASAESGFDGMRMAYGGFTPLF